MKWEFLYLVLVSAMFVVPCWAVESFPYSTGFESPSFAAGDLAGQNFWAASSGTVIANAAKAYEGDQAIRLGSENGYVGTATMPELIDDPCDKLIAITYMLNHGDRLNRTQPGNSYMEIRSNLGYRMFRLTFSATDGKVLIQNGVDTGYLFEENTWYKVSVIINQHAGGGNTAFFYLDDQLIASNVASEHYLSTGIKDIFFSGGAHLGGWPTNDHYTYLDALEIQQYVPTGPAFPYATGFELPDWFAGDAVGQNGSTGNSVSIVSNAAKAFRGNQVLRLGYDNGYSGNFYTQEITGDVESGKLFLQAMINHGDRLSGTQAGNTLFELTGNNFYRTFRITLSALDHKILVQNGLDTGLTFEENRWYKVRIEIDQSSVPSTADFYLDDALIAEGVPSESTLGVGIHKIHFGGGSHVGGWPANDHFSYIDDIAIGAILPEPLPEGMIGFEQPDYVLGDLVGQNGWTGNSVAIAGGAYHGDQAMKLGYANGYSGNAYSYNIEGDPNTGVIFAECMINHGDRLGFTQAGNTGLYIEGNDGYRAYGLLFDTTTQSIVIQNTIDTGYSFQENTWYHVKVVMYQDNPSGIGTADFYLDGNLIASNVNSIHSISRGISQFHFYGGSHVGGWPTNDHYSYVDNLWWGIIPEPPEPLVSDINKDRITDMIDLAMVTGRWLDCTEPGQAGCSIAAPITSSQIAMGTAVVDGNLDEWDMQSEAVDLNQVYDRDPCDITARMALRWDGDTNKIYAAIVVTDLVHYFHGDWGGAWDAGDTIEIYTQGDAAGGTYNNTICEQAQQMIVGPKLSTAGGWASWAYGVALPNTDPATDPNHPDLDYAVVVNGDQIIYELGIKQYDNFAGRPGAVGATEVTQLAIDRVVGLDIVVGSRHGTEANDYGMLCLNTQPSKFANADNFTQYQLVASLTCGAWGYWAEDIVSDCRVDLNDFALIASEWLVSTNAE